MPCYVSFSLRFLQEEQISLYQTIANIQNMALIDTSVNLHRRIDQIRQTLRQIRLQIDPETKESFIRVNEQSRLIHPHIRKRHDNFSADRQQICEMLEADSTTRAMIALLVLDALCVFVEILMLEEQHILTEHMRLTVEWTCHHISLAILVVFLAEILMHLYAFRTEILHEPGYILDAIVIPVSLIIELIFSGGGLLIILRGWRIVRLTHSAFTVEMERKDEEMRELGAKVSNVEQCFELLVKDLEKR